MVRLFPCLLCVTSLGCLDPTALSEAIDQPDEATAAPEIAGAVVETNERAQPPSPTGGKPAETVLTFERRAILVDKHKAMQENPNLVETQNRINASDPITAIGQAPFAARSRIHTTALKHDLDLYKAQHDRYPSFAEYEAILKQHNVKLDGLHPWQVYAYDDQTGEITILEDPDKNRR